MRRGGVDYCLEALGLGGREQSLGCVCGGGGGAWEGRFVV